MSGRFDRSSSAKERMTRAQELLKAWELDASEIKILEKLGEGGQGVVVRGWWHGMEVAIKQPRPLKGSRGKPISPDAFGPTSPHDSFNQALRREVRALSRVRHPNVIKLHGACFEPAPMVLMSYAPSGTLQDALDNRQFQTPLAMVRLLAGIARGMEAVHAHKIIHLDLKPENVLIG
ncbi:mitogen-activated protein kinase kinase kinase 12-like protein, partial [Chrysochromulina tobinii]